MEAVDEDSSPALRFLNIGALVMVVLFAAGACVSSRNTDRRADALRAEAAERRLAAESRAIGNDQAARVMRMEAQAAESRRVEANQRAIAQGAEERRLAYEAQRRVEADKQRVRQLCWQNYRTPDC